MTFSVFCQIAEVMGLTLFGLLIIIIVVLFIQMMRDW